MLPSLEDGCSCSLNAQTYFKNITQKTSELSKVNELLEKKDVFLFKKHMTEHNPGLQSKHKLWW